MKYKLIFPIIFLCIMLVLPFTQSDTTFFEDDFFIMVNHSFLQEGLSGAMPTIPPIVAKPDVVVEAKEIPKEIIVEVIKIIKIVPWYIWFFIAFLFLSGWRTRRKINIERSERLKSQKGKTKNLYSL